MSYLDLCYINYAHHILRHSSIIYRLWTDHELQKPVFAKSATLGSKWYFAVVGTYYQENTQGIIFWKTVLYNTSDVRCYNAPFNPLVPSAHKNVRITKIPILKLEWIVKKISYERRDYESVDEKILS